MSERRGRTSASQRLDTAAAARRVDRLQRGGRGQKIRVLGRSNRLGCHSHIFFPGAKLLVFHGKKPCFFNSINICRGLAKAFFFAGKLEVSSVLRES